MWSRVLPEKLTQHFLILSRYSPILSNQTVHRRVHKNPPPAPCLEPEQSSPRPPIPLLQEVCEYYFAPMPGSSHWSLSCWFPHPKPYINFCYPTYVLHAQSISSLITGIVFYEEYRSRSSSLCSFLQSPIVSTLFCPNIFLSTSFSNTLSPRYSLYMTDHISYSCQITGKIIFPCILILICLGIKRKGKRFIHEATNSALMSLYDILYIYSLS